MSKYSYYKDTKAKRSRMEGEVRPTAQGKAQKDPYF